MQLLDAPSAARLLSAKTACLYSKVWRMRVGLRAVRIGRSLRFREDDCRRLIDKGTERLPEGYEERR